MSHIPLESYGCLVSVGFYGSWFRYSETKLWPFEWTKVRSENLLGFASIHGEPKLCCPRSSIPSASRSIIQMRMQRWQDFLVLQEIFQGFPIPYQERSPKPSHTRELEVKDEHESTLYKGARISYERRYPEHNVDAKRAETIHQSSPFHSFMFL